jgi:hypothetical protein
MNIFKPKIETNSDIFFDQENVLSSDNLAESIDIDAYCSINRPISINRCMKKISGHNAYSRQIILICNKLNEYQQVYKDTIKIIENKSQENYFLINRNSIVKKKEKWLDVSSKYILIKGCIKTKNDLGIYESCPSLQSYLHGMPKIASCSKIQHSRITNYQDKFKCQIKYRHDEVSRYVIEMDSLKVDRYLKIIKPKPSDFIICFDMK